MRYFYWKIAKFAQRWGQSFSSGGWRLCRWFKKI